VLLTDSVSDSPGVYVAPHATELLPRFHETVRDELAADWPIIFEPTSSELLQDREPG